MAIEIKEYATVTKDYTKEEIEEIIEVLAASIAQCLSYDKKVYKLQEMKCWYESIWRCFSRPQ